MSSIDDIIQRLTDLYEKGVGSNNYNTLLLNAEQLDTIRQQSNAVKLAHFVNDATGISLDNLGKILDTPRLAGESDNDYRARLKGTIPSLIGGGTKEQLSKVVALVLSIDASLVVVEDGYTDAGKYGHARILIYAPITQPPSVINDTIDTNRAAGIMIDYWGGVNVETQNASDNFFIEFDLFTGEFQSTSDDFTIEMEKLIKESQSTSDVDFPFYHYTGLTKTWDGVSSARVLNVTKPS